MSETAPPGTLRERADAAVIVFHRAIQWLVSNPDETLGSFQAWLQAQEWPTAGDDLGPIIRWDVGEISRKIWQIFEELR